MPSHDEAFTAVMQRNHNYYFTYVFSKQDRYTRSVSERKLAFYVV